MRGVWGLGCLLLFWMFPIVVNCDDKINGFITDVISTFKLLSPTILHHGDAPEICFTHRWVLCLNLENEQALLMKDGGNSYLASSE